MQKHMEKPRRGLIQGGLSCRGFQDFRWSGNPSSCFDSFWPERRRLARMAAILGISCTKKSVRQMRWNVRYGSLADVRAAIRDVRLPSKNGHAHRRPQCLQHSAFIEAVNQRQEPHSGVVCEVAASLGTTSWRSSGLTEISPVNGRL